jgi:RNA polymerase sigma-70 factor (ECF subfamily)
MSGAQAEKYLIEAVQRGDQQAWREVIARYQGRLLSFARRMLAQRGDAEDLVQETFLGLLRSLPNYDPARSLETYLLPFCVTSCTTSFAKQSTAGGRFWNS